MLKSILIAGGIIVFGLVLAVYSCCVMAGRDDDRNNRNDF